MYHPRSQYSGQPAQHQQHAQPESQYNGQLNQYQQSPNQNTQNQHQHQQQQNQQLQHIDHVPQSTIPSKFAHLTTLPMFPLFVESDAAAILKQHMDMRATINDLQTARNEFSGAVRTENVMGHIIADGGLGVAPGALFSGTLKASQLAIEFASSYSITQKTVSHVTRWAIAPGQDGEGIIVDIYDWHRVNDEMGGRPMFAKSNTKAKFTFQNGKYKKKMKAQKVWNKWYSKGPIDDMSLILKDKREVKLELVERHECVIPAAGGTAIMERFKKRYMVPGGAQN